MKILNYEDRQSFIIKPNNEADYIIDNYRNWFGDYKKKRYKIPNNFENIKIYREKVE